MHFAEETQFRDFAAARIAKLRRVGFLICGDWHLAEDAVSTVLTKLYSAWPRVKHVEHLDAYVRSMLIHAIVDERRRPWRRELPVDFTDPVTAGAGSDVVNDRIVLREALDRMPPRRRAVLVLRYFEQLTIEETADAMDCSVGTVKSQTTRALATLRELLPVDFTVPEGGRR